MASERGTRTRLAIGAIAAAVALLATEARAEPDPEALKEAARELGREGVRRYDSGDWEGAQVRFRQAYRLVPAPSLAVREARALVKLSRLVEASEAYSLAANASVDASSPVAFRDAVAEATMELDTLRRRIPRVLITVLGPDKTSSRLSVRIDGTGIPNAAIGVPRPVDPGIHRIEATFGERGAPAVETVSLREADVKTVVLRLATPIDPDVAPAAPAKPAAPDASGSTTARTLGWTGVAVGGAGLAIGVVAGILAAGRESDLEAECKSARCPSSAQDDIDAYGTLRTVSTIGYVTGAIAAGVGVTLLITAPDAPRTQARSAPLAATIEPWIGAGRGGVRGTF